MAEEAIMGHGVQVSLWPKDIWEWAQRPEIKKRLKSEIVSIAESSLTGCEICVSVESNLVTLFVYRGEEKVYSEAVVSSLDCMNTAQKLFNRYLPEHTKDDGDDDPDIDRIDLELEIDDREDYLRFSFLDFLSAACDCDMSAAYDAGYKDDIDDAFVDILSRLATEHGFGIYRPMFIVEDDTGDEIYTEYPYEDYDLTGGTAKAGT